MDIRATFLTADLKDKRVFLRADLNVPLRNGSIESDHRLQALLPTLDALIERGARICIATHVGEPTHPSAELSTQHLVPWFAHRGYTIAFAENPEAAYQLSTEQKDSIIMLENLRFFPGEQTHDNTFAQQLARIGDYYINDAFATMHRNDTSITLVPNLFAPHNRSIGLLVEKELQELSKLIDRPHQPFVVIIGGGKAHTKIPLIRALMGTASAIILCPAIVFTFLKALKKPVGKSLVDDESIDICMDIIKKSQETTTALLFPTDYIVAHGALDGEQSIVCANEFPEDGVGISFGPETMASVHDIIHDATTVFYNGLMGDMKYPQTLAMTKQIFESMGSSDAFTVIGGGDSVALAQTLSCADTINYLSTGGGAALAFLAGEKLPGLAVFKS